MSRRIAIAMSGGVDSSVAAYLLKEAGHELVGLTMKIWPDSRCCSAEAMQDAAEIAARLGIPHEVLDFVPDFTARVVDPFGAAYLAGLTPNPCAVCNSQFKFAALFDAAQERFGVEAVATGHYARIREAIGRYELLRGRDFRKDQSYVLYRLDQRQLSRTLFPLGELTKDRVRAIATGLGYAVAEKPESQDLCFSSDARSFLRERLAGRYGEGPIEDLDGRRLGNHQGIIHYTVGQRKGLGIASPEPLYVVRIDAERNAVVVGPRSATLGADLLVEDFHWSAGQPPAGPVYAQVKIRYGGESAEAMLTPRGSAVAIAFDEPQYAITPGQVAVAYQGDVVLGGGLIGRPAPVAATRS